MPRLGPASVKSITINFPWRRTAWIVLPTICCGWPRSTRGHRNSAARIRQPASRGARPRTMVSTSGNSGMLGNINQDVVTGDLRRKRGDLDGVVVIVLAGAAIELPGVPGTGEVRAVNGPLSQRSAAVRAGSRERVNAAIHIADGEAVLSDRGFHYRPGRELRQRPDLHEWHVLIVARWRLPCRDRC